MNNLARKYARILVLGHYLFREVDSFPGAKLDQKTASFEDKRAVWKLGNITLIFSSFDGEYSVT